VLFERLKIISRPLAQITFCIDANEMINTIQIAMNEGFDYQVVRDIIFTHPSVADYYSG
jgi:pyruvate/2-oxoglutarate dehydrogenase complex dihydrolipoamide dehydrogenase (E3) component